jgi:hypothetical protein
MIGRKRVGWERRFYPYINSPWGSRSKTLSSSIQWCTARYLSSSSAPLSSPFLRSHFRFGLAGLRGLNWLLMTPVAAPVGNRKAFNLIVSPRLVHTAIIHRPWEFHPACLFCQFWVTFRTLFYILFARFALLKLNTPQRISPIFVP